MAYTPENNPYVPGDPYSYDLKWIVARIKEWGSQYGTFSKALAELEKNFAGLLTYVNNFINDLDISQEISDKLEEMYADGRLQTAIAEAFLNDNSYKEPAVIAEYLAPTTYGLQGFTCFRRGVQNVGVYYLDGTTDVGRLIAFDMDSYTELFNINFQGYHGNSITYNPNDDALYIASCQDHSDPDNPAPTPYVVRAPFTAPGNYTEITLPGGNTAFSVVYVPEDDQFLVQYAGTDPVVHIYNAALDTELDTVALSGYNVIGQQGIQCYAEGVVYAAVWRNAPKIYAYDLSDGSLVKIFNIPDIISGYKELKELESCSFNARGNLVFAAQCYSAIGNASLAFCEIPIHAPVAIERPYRFNQRADALITLQVNDNVTDYTPAWVYGKLKDLADLNAVFSATGRPLNASCDNTGINATKTVYFTFDGYVNLGGKGFPDGICCNANNIQINNAYITGDKSYTSPTRSAGLNAWYGAKVYLTNISISGQSQYPIYAGEDAHVTIGSGCNITKVNGYDGLVSTGGSIKQSLNIAASTPPTVAVYRTMGAQVSRLATETTFTKNTQTAIPLDAAGAFTKYRAFYNGQASDAVRVGNTVKWSFGDTEIASGVYTPYEVQVTADITTGYITITHIYKTLLKSSWTVTEPNDITLTIEAIKEI